MHCRIRLFLVHNDHGRTLFFPPHSGHVSPPISLNPAGPWQSDHAMNMTRTTKQVIPRMIHLIQPKPAMKRPMVVTPRRIAKSKKYPGALLPPGAGWANAAEYLWPQCWHFMSLHRTLKLTGVERHQPFHVRYSALLSAVLENFSKVCKIRLRFFD